MFYISRAHGFTKNLAVLLLLLSLAACSKGPSTSQIRSEMNDDIQKSLYGLYDAADISILARDDVGESRQVITVSFNLIRTRVQAQDVWREVRFNPAGAAAVMAASRVPEGTKDSKEPTKALLVYVKDAGSWKIKSIGPLN